MPVYETPEPIIATLELDCGTARITAGKRTETVVEVLPRDGADDKDVQAVQQTQVSCSGGRLAIKTPKKRSLFGKPGTVEVSVELPAGSDVRGTTALGGFFCEGSFGEVTSRPRSATSRSTRRPAPTSGPTTATSAWPARPETSRPSAQAGSRSAPSPARRPSRTATASSRSARSPAA